MNDRIPPNKLDLETAVLGAMLIGGPEAIDAARGILNPEAFYVQAHRHVFTACCRLADRREPADLPTVTTELERMGKLEEAGGPGKVTELAGSMATTANLEYYARQVRDAYVRRLLIDRAGQLAARCFEAGEDIGDLLDAVRRAESAGRR